MFEQLTRTGTAEGGWVGEREDREETDAPTLGLDSFPLMELYSEPIITQKLLDDSELDVEAWLAGEVGETFGVLESDAWFNGSGMNQPRGLLTYPFVVPASWAHGKFRYIATGVSGDFAASKPDNKLIDLQTQIKKVYRVNAQWLANRTTLGAIRKLKDGEDRPLWQPSTQAGQPDMLLGHAISESEDMPNMGADTYALAFGDWRRTYLILDRLGVTVLRNPFKKMGWVSFHTRKRVGGGVQNFDAAAFLKFGTS
jgi:HK97 family phage major capsid protein